MTRIGIAAALAVLLALPAPAAGERKVWQGTITAGSLNVRDGPGRDHAIIGKLRRGDTVEAVDQSGDWVRLAGDSQEWVYRSFVALPDDFMAPEFSDAEDAFIDWAVAGGDLVELAVGGKGALSLELREDLYAEAGKPAEVARRIACGYRERLDHGDTVTVTVWAHGGPVMGVAGRFTCP